MDIVLGVCICAGTFFLYRHLDGKLKEKLCVARERTNLKNEYEELIKKTKAEYHAIVDGLDVKAAEMKASFNELGLSSVFDCIYDYESFSEMLSYAKNHPKQTTASSYLKELRERSQQARHISYIQSQFDPDYSERVSQRLSEWSEPREEQSTYHPPQSTEIYDKMSQKMWQDKKALEKCSHCINTNKCGYSVKQHSLTCSAFQPK